MKKIPTIGDKVWVRFPLGRWDASSKLEGPGIIKHAITMAGGRAGWHVEAEDGHSWNISVLNVRPVEES